MFTPIDPNRCPVCKSKGKEVDFQNVFCNLKDIAKLNKDRTYRHCPNPKCQVVYFAFNETFTNNDLIRSMALKSEDPNTTVCYCFDYKREQMNQNSYQEFLEKLKTGCACAIKNPSGNCCKSLFKDFIQL